MVLILVESIESMIGKFCSKFILSNEMEKAESTTTLSKLDVTDKKNIHNREFEVSFAIKHDILALMKVGKISDSQVYAFKMEAKDFLSTLCNQILQRSPLNSYFARCTRSLNPLYLAEAPALSKKLFSALLSKLELTYKFAHFGLSVVRENEGYFSEYNLKSDRVDEFYMRYLKGSIHYETLLIFNLSWYYLMVRRL